MWDRLKWHVAQVRPLSDLFTTCVYDVLPYCERSLEWSITWTKAAQGIKSRKTPTCAERGAVPSCFRTCGWQQRGRAPYIQDTEVVTTPAALRWKVIHLEYRFPLHMHLAWRECSEGCLGGLVSVLGGHDGNEWAPWDIQAAAWRERAQAERLSRGAASYCPNVVQFLFLSWWARFSNGNVYFFLLLKASFPKRAQQI